MSSVGAPFNEKRQQAVMIIFQAERLPVKDFAIRALPRSGLRTFKFDSFVAQPGRKLIQIVAMCSPTDKARLFEFCDDRVLSHARLFRIGSDDFEVATRIQVSGAALTQRNKRVLRAAAWMDTAEHSRDSGALLDKGDAAIEITTAEKDVIKQCRKACNLALRRPNGRRQDCSRGDSDKSSA